MRNVVILPTMICLIILILSVIQLLVSNKLSTDGLMLTNLEQEIDSYRQKSMLLSEEITKSMALTQLSSKAAELGFIKEGRILSISGVMVVALNQ